MSRSHIKIKSVSTAKNLFTDEEERLIAKALNQAAEESGKTPEQIAGETDTYLTFLFTDPLPPGYPEMPEDMKTWRDQLRQLYGGQKPNPLRYLLDQYLFWRSLHQDTDTEA